MLHNQLRQAPVDLFMDELMADSFLMSSLKVRHQPSNSFHLK